MRENSGVMSDEPGIVEPLPPGIVEPLPPGTAEPVREVVAHNGQRFVGGTGAEIIYAMLHALRLNGIEKLSGKGWQASAGSETKNFALLVEALAFRIHPRPEPVGRSIPESLRNQWRAMKGQGMTSAVGEYTPQEFWELLDAYEALLPHPSAADGRDDSWLREITDAYRLGKQHGSATAVPVVTENKPPQPAFTVEISVGACDWERLAVELVRAAEHVQEHGQHCNRVWGGAGTHGHVHITKRDVTQEQYNRELAEWWNRKRSSHPTTTESET